MLLLAEPELPVAHVDPAPELHADLREMGGLAESQPFVQRDAAFVR